jgi:2-polyprenyl-3-methyl-5-hydroxy-6-metoxy-1,4-benzoquinol methylase
VEYHIPEFAEFQKWSGRKVLEIGCGLGTTAMSFARCGAAVTAVDISDESLKWAQRRAILEGLNIKFYQANAEKLSDVVPLETYDLIFSFGVLHHTPNPPKAFEEIKKYMGPKSQVRVMVYHKYSWKVFWILIKCGKGAYWRLDKLIAENSEAAFGCPITFCYGKESVRELFKGYEITNMSVDHIFPYDIKEYVQHRYRKVWYFRWIPKVLFRCLEKKLGWHLCVTARLK